MNIVSEAMATVDATTVERAAFMLGTDAASARIAIGAALPAILAVLSGKGATLPGAGAVFDRVRDARDDLGAILGTGETGPLGRAVAGFTGSGERRAIHLLAMLGPVALGAIGREIARQGLDKAGLSRFLSDQRGNIVEALPTGFSAHVAGSRHFDTFRTGFASEASAPVTVTTRNPDPRRTWRQARLPMRWWIAGPTVLGMAAWLLYGANA